MKNISCKGSKGFTLVELLVVIAIMGIMMAMAAGVLRDTGKGRGLDSGVDLLESMVREARATAQGNDTYTRLVIASDEKDTSTDSRHLRYMTVQLYQKEDNKSGKYDGTQVDQGGRWVTTSAGVMLPPNVYFSPTYSKPLQWMEGAAGDMIGTEVTRLSGRGQTKVYFIQFDEKGRFVAPNGDPLNPTRAQRLVIISGKRGKGNRAKDGVIPSDVDSSRRPAAAKGIVVWPTGDVSDLRTTTQVYQK